MVYILSNTISCRAFHQLYRCEALYGSQADAQQQGKATKPPHGKWVPASSKPLFLVFLLLPIGSMYGIYGNIYHQYTPHVSIYTIHGSYGLLINNVNPGLINHGL